MDFFLSPMKGGCYGVVRLQQILVWAFLLFAAPGTAQFSVSIEQTDPLCAGFPTGTVRAIPSGGQEPYTYHWNNGATDRELRFLFGGTYRVTVTDGLDNTTTAEATLATPEPIEATFDTETCAFPFTVSVKPTGGAPPYKLAWETGESDSSITVDEPGKYCLTITDALNCSAVKCVEVIDNDPPQVMVMTVPERCPGNHDGQATAMPNGGERPYGYLWSNGQTSATTRNLAPGNYTVTVTDANGCTSTGSGFILAADPMCFRATSFLKPVCLDATDGRISVEVFKGTPPYTYQWSNGAAGPTIDGLDPGTYSVTATDAKGCQADTTFELSYFSGLDLEVLANPQVCPHVDNANILAKVINGYPPFRYEWSNGSRDSVLFDVSPGSYSVTVTDALGCTISKSTVVTPADPLTIEILSTNSGICASPTGRIQVRILEGEPPFTYLWNTGAITPAIENLTPGWYEVTVTDSRGCEAVDAITIAETPAINLEVMGSKFVCEGVADGTAEAIVTGGTPPFSFFWSTGSIGPSIENLPVGDYRVTVVDDRGCEATDTITISGVPEVEIAIHADTLLCIGESDATASVTVVQGTAPFDFAWSTKASTPGISNLGPGVYRVTVTDANGCVAVDSAGITEEQAIDLNFNTLMPSCPGEANGAVEVLPGGGAGPYSFLWNTGDTAVILTGVSADVYIVTVTDANACQATDSVFLAEPEPLELLLKNSDHLCVPGETGTATVAVNGGTAPFIIQWSDGQTGLIAEELAPGSYDVKVADVNGCLDTIPVTITSSEDLAIELTIRDINCDNPAGSILAEVSGGIPPYRLLWSTGANTDSIGNLDAGVYNLLVIDSQECSVAVDSIVVRNVDPPVCDVEILENVSVLGATDGKAVVNISGGTPPYDILWSDGQTTDTACDLTNAVHFVTVTDAEGCLTTCSGQAPVVETAALGDFVWFDRDRDGIQDPGEPGIEGVRVIVQSIQEEDAFMDTLFTDRNGRYLFFLESRNYKVTFELPNPDFVPTTPNVGPDDNLDSDADPVDFMTNIFFLRRGDVDLTRDAGFFLPCDNITDPGDIGDDQKICGPGEDPNPILSKRSASGGTGVLEYLWMKSTVGGPFSMDTYQPIPNSNSPDFDPGPVYQTTFFTRCARRIGCPGFLEPENPVVIVVGDDAKADIVSTDQVCVEESLTLRAATQTRGARVRWEFLGPSTISTAEGREVTIDFSSFGILQVKLIVNENGCEAHRLKTISITNNPAICGGNLNLDAEVFGEDSVLLEWHMLEDGMDYQFAVEYAEDGSDYQHIAQVDTPSAVINKYRMYRYLDQKRKNGLNFYRVLMISPGEATHYSKPVALLVELDSKLMMVYPNPTSGLLHLEFYKDYGAPIHIYVSNTKGAIVDQEILPAGTLSHQLDWSGYPQGLYFIRISYGNFTVKGLKVMRN